MGNIEKFDAMADRYDTEERAKIAGIIADAILSRVQDGQDKTAIDYGCGTGLVGLRLLDAFGDLLFVDAAENMVEQVRYKLETLVAKNAGVLCCDFAAGTPDLRADYILVVQMLLHEKDIRALLARFAQLLNKGGHLIIVDFDKNANIVSEDVHNGFDQKELAGVLHDLSFANIESRTFYHGKKMFMNQDASLFILDALII